MVDLDRGHRGRRCDSRSRPAATDLARASCARGRGWEVADFRHRYLADLRSAAFGGAPRVRSPDAARYLGNPAAKSDPAARRSRVAGRAGAERQKGQDANAAALAPASGAVVQRAVAKASANYQNSTWDLVDAAKEENFDVSKLKTEELPAEMRKMKLTERKAFIEKNMTKRGELQKKIQQLNADRDQYVAQRRKETSGVDTLDAAVISAVREQGAKRNLVFK